MDFIELAQSRRSIRDFQQQSISKDDLIKLITAAQSAPSAGNWQPWHFYIISDKRLQREIRNQCGNQEFMMAAPVFIVVCALTNQNRSTYGRRGKALYCIQDTAAAIQNILLCAKSLGLGACWCGAFHEKSVRKILRLKKSTRPVAVIPVGYPVADPDPTWRRPLEESVTFLGD
jgi:nitroreductase